MSLLQEGYVVDVPYPTFVHRQAMPIWLNSLVKAQSYQAPDLNRPYRYLELGCAMGIHLHLTASSNPLGHFVGVDFNPQQLLVAQEGLASTQINNLEFIHASFAELLQQDLEPFDFIVTHGVWSWISKENQQIMLKIIHKFLKPNGILYCSYMSHPGATHLTSVQKLMTEMSRNLKGDSATKAMQSLHLARQIGKSELGLFAKIPSLNEDLSQLAKDKPNYIAHDFLSEHWQPQHSADMLRLFGNIGLAYTTGAGIIENIDALNLTPEIQKLVKSLPLITLQETVKDIARNTLQRQDVYIRQRQKLTEQQQHEFYHTLKFSLLPHAPVATNLKDNEKLGQLQDVIPVFEAILKLLAKQPLSFNDLLQHLQFKLSTQQFTDIVFVLVWAGYIHPLREDTQAAPYAEATNQWMQAQQLPWRSITQLGTALEIKP